MKTEAEIIERLDELEEELLGMPFYEPSFDKLVGEQIALEWVLGIE